MLGHEYQSLILIVTKKFIQYTFDSLAGLKPCIHFALILIYPILPYYVCYALAASPFLSSSFLVKL